MVSTSTSKMYVNDLEKTTAPIVPELRLGKKIDLLMNMNFVL